MKRVLLTGAGGFIGRNLKEALQERCVLFAPPHSELELLDGDALERYVAQRQIDVILHAAIHVPVFHGAANELQNDMRMFLNLEKASRHVEKMLYFGSGAEFDKRYDIRMAGEDAFGRSVPVSEYGLAKYTMNMIARGSDNIYNLRLFGIFGKYELWQVKFLSNLCCKAAFGLPLTVRRDCRFDFLYVEDLPDIVSWFMEHTPQWHDYNVCHGQEYHLTALAEMVRQASGKDVPVVLLNGERNLDYSADVSRLRTEMSRLRITPMEQALEELYHYYQAHKSMIDYETLKNSR